MMACVGSHVPLVGPFVVLDGGHRLEGGAVGEALEGELLALDALLDDHPVRAADALLDDLPCVGDHLFLVRQLLTLDANALAAGQPDGLDHKAARVSADEGLHLHHVVEGVVLDAAGNVVAQHQVPGECLVRLDTGGGLGGRCGGDARFHEGLHYALL